MGIVEHMTVPPSNKKGCCSSCGRTGRENGPYVTTGASDRQHGVIVFCAQCVRSMGKRLGMASPVEVANLEKDIDSLAHLVAEFEWKAKEYDRLQDVVKSFAE